MIDGAYPCLGGGRRSVRDRTLVCKEDGRIARLEKNTLRTVRLEMRQ